MGKYLKLFNKLSDYETFKGGVNWITPNVSLILENGKQMRYSKRVVQPSEPNIPPTNLITFTIDGVIYQAEDGMTWGEWVDSEYNVDGYLVYNNNLIVKIIDGNTICVVYLNQNAVLSHEIIIKYAMCDIVIPGSGS
jgi:hypothetical protein